MMMKPPNSSFCKQVERCRHKHQRRNRIPLFFFVAYYLCLASLPQHQIWVEGLLFHSSITSSARPFSLRNQVFSTGSSEERPEEPVFVPKYTGLDKRLKWDLANPPVPIRSELALLDSGVLWRRGEFTRIEGQRLKDVNDKCCELGMTVAQGLLIRKQLAVTTAMSNNRKLTNQFDSIERKICSQKRTLLELSKDLDLPPVSILRAVIKKRVLEAYPDDVLPKPYRTHKQIVQAVIREEASELDHPFLSAWETDQLQEAKRFDVIGYSECASEIESVKWERAIYALLDEHDINYMTEDDLRAVGSRITPDCVFLDNCVINGSDVRWIDAKDFYGSGLRESSGIVNKLKKQIAKYETEFGGSGAIVFKHGFSQKLQTKFPSTLFLDAGPLHWDN